MCIQPPFFAAYIKYFSFYQANKTLLLGFGNAVKPFSGLEISFAISCRAEKIL
jgi:hypothetical protein